MTFSDGTSAPDDENAGEPPRHTNTPCRGYEDSATLFRTQEEKRSEKMPSKLKYFKSEQWRLPIYQHTGERIIHTAPEGLQTFSAENKEVGKSHVGRSPLTHCFSARKLGSAKTESKREKHRVVHYGKDFENKKNSLFSRQEVLDLSSTKPYFQVYSFGIRGKSKLTSTLDKFPRYPIRTFSNYNPQIHPICLERPLKQEKGKYTYRSTSDVNLPVPEEKLTKEKSSKSADVYLKHLQLSANGGLVSRGFPMYQHTHYQNWDTKLLEAVSKYNRPLWEDIIGRQISVHETLGTLQYFPQL